VFPGEPIPSERLRFIDADYQGTPVTVLNNDVTGEKGLQVIVAAEGAGRMRDYLIQSGRAEDMALVGRAAWNMRRLEAGLPWFGADVSDNFPTECRLGHLVSYEKGCFLGQEPLARMHHRGHPNWLLVGLSPAGGSFPVRTPAFFSVESAHTLPSDREQVAGALRALDLAAVVPTNTLLRAAGDGGKPCGRVTSAVFSPKLQSPLLMGYVRAGLAETGQEMLLSLGEADIVLAVTPLPVE
jgi:folate-binding protein YgfZ